MLFHIVREVDAPGSSIELGRGGGKKKKVSAVNPAVLIWASFLIVFFVAATFAAHILTFDRAETIFLNLVVVLTAASIGEFLGERIAAKDLLEQ